MGVGLYDLRPDSPTRGRSALFVLTAGDQAILTFPRGLVHGWIAHAHTTHLQAVSETYASYGADDNEGCRWDDPALELAWPVKPTVISARSRTFGSLADLERRLALAPTLRTV
jgi:dTDP-4-dehydrorhamnose 3,5-epimerase